MEPRKSSCKLYTRPKVVHTSVNVNYGEIAFITYIYIIVRPLFDDKVLFEG